jgi:4-amino-4-deoxy-L-arabinose transferase-like glycosyltransferase
MELRGLRHFGLARQVKFACAALAALTLLRLVLAAVMPLAPDEAYYWLWSRHLQAGYFDHPPMVALWIRAGTWVAGQTPLGVRLLGPFSGFAGSFFIWSAAEDLLPNRGTGLAAAALLNATVMVGAGAIIMTPDTPLFFFWTAALAACGRLIARQNPRWWLAIGAAAGLALLSKYTAVLLIAGIGFWLLTRRDGRAALRTVWPWAGLGLGLLIFLPNLLWNGSHGWVSYLKQGGRVAQFDAGRAAQFLAELVIGQIGLATPIIFGLMAAGIWRLGAAKDAGSRLLLWLTLLPAAVFLEHVLSDRVQSNWPAVVYPAACIAAAGMPALRIWLKPAVVCGLGLTAIVYVQALTGCLPLPAREDPTALQLAGWRAFATQVAATKAAFYTSDEYGPAAEMAFLQPHAVIAGFGGNLDRRWDYLHLPAAANLAGATGILVTRRLDTSCPVPLGTVTRTRDDSVIATYRLCRFVAPAGGVLLPHP